LPHRVVAPRLRNTSLVPQPSNRSWVLKDCDQRVDDQSTRVSSPTTRADFIVIEPIGSSMAPTSSCTGPVTVRCSGIGPYAIWACINASLEDPRRKIGDPVEISMPKSAAHRANISTIRCKAILMD
jgi:hypothetical protein